MDNETKEQYYLGKYTCTNHEKKTVIFSKNTQLIIFSQNNSFCEISENIPIGQKIIILGEFSHHFSNLL